jgi:predicted DNA-binding transcriptional regulator YafY
MSLRRRRFVTAAQLAEQLEVSERTIYRDIQDLSSSGVPVVGEAGVGYQLKKGFDLPPLMFTVDEIEALVLGARVVERWGDDALRTAARSVLDKAHAVSPPASKERLANTPLFAISFVDDARDRDLLGQLRAATTDQRKVKLAYADREGEETERVVRPLALYFWGRAWTVGGWCELREDFRNFRLDRIASLEVTADTFELESPVTLEDYQRAQAE